MSKTYIDARNAAVECIKKAFGKDNVCKIYIDAHPGRFDEAEIRRLATRTPAILTSMLRIDDENGEATFVSWVLARAGNKDKLYDAALSIVSALIPAIRDLDCEWSVDAPRNIEAECLYSGSLDAINVTMWAVRWVWKLQKTVLAEGGFPALDFENFEGYEAEHRAGGASASDNVNI